jgi:hypothetical protein
MNYGAQPGLVVVAMVLDTLSGRSPLYRLIDFFEGKDTELLLGEDIPLFGRTRDGNASDNLKVTRKTLNNELLGNISKHMARHGLSQGAFVYVTD